MRLSTRTLAGGALTALLAYFLLTAPVQAAQTVRTLVSQLAIATDSILLFLQHLGT